jgi:hypothetical protein
MPTLAAVLKQLEVKRNRTKTELERLNEAIAALKKLGPGENVRRRGRRPGRKLSAAARRKISAAQKKRQAKARKQKTAEVQG